MYFLRRNNTTFLQGLFKGAGAVLKHQGLLLTYGVRGRTHVHIIRNPNHIHDPMFYLLSLMQ